MIKKTDLKTRSTLSIDGVAKAAALVKTLNVQRAINAERYFWRHAVDGVDRGARAPPTDSGVRFMALRRSLQSPRRCCP